MLGLGFCVSSFIEIIKFVIVALFFRDWELDNMSSKNRCWRLFLLFVICSILVECFVKKIFINIIFFVWVLGRSYVSVIRYSIFWI